MTTSYSVGSTGNTPEQNRTAILNVLNNLPAADSALIACTGKFAAFRIPKNIVAARPVEITSANTAAPAQMLGICLTGGGDNVTNAGLFRNPNVPDQQATSVNGLTISWITMRAPRVGPVIQLNASGTQTYKLTGGGGDGYGWHIDYSFPGCTGLRQTDGASLIAIPFGNTADNITIRDCSFNGWAGIIDLTGGHDNIDIRHNLFEEWCEDTIYVPSAANGLTIEYNLWRNFRGLNVDDARDGFGRTRPEPPHSDMVQFSATTKNLIYQYNECYDDTNRAHPLLLKIADGAGGGTQPAQSKWHVNPTVRNNFAESTHTNGFWGYYIIGGVCERNKQRAGAGGDPTIAWGRGGIGTVQGEDLRCGNNVSPGFAPKLNNVTNEYDRDFYATNQITNSATVLPTGWIEFRRGHPNLAQGALYTGPGGGGGGVVTPTPPAALTTGQVAFGALVQDPAFPDARKTFTITVPAGSPARDAFEMRWSSDADVNVRAMIRLSDAGGNQVWRATSGQIGHLRSPNESFVNVRLYYRETEGGLLSDPSTYTFSVTVPYVADPDPIPTNIIDFRTLRRVYAAGQIAEIRAPGVRWRPML